MNFILSVSRKSLCSRIMKHLLGSNTIMAILWLWPEFSHGCLIVCIELIFQTFTCSQSSNMQKLAAFPTLMVLKTGFKNKFYHQHSIPAVARGVDLSAQCLWLSMTQKWWGGYLPNHNCNTESSTLHLSNLYKGKGSPLRSVLRQRY